MELSGSLFQRVVLASFQTCLVLVLICVSSTTQAKNEVDWVVDYGIGD